MIFSEVQKKTKVFSVQNIVWELSATGCLIYSSSVGNALESCILSSGQFTVATLLCILSNLGCSNWRWSSWATGTE